MTTSIANSHHCCTANTTVVKTPIYDTVAASRFVATSLPSSSSKAEGKGTDRASGDDDPAHVHKCSSAHADAAAALLQAKADKCVRVPQRGLPVDTRFEVSLLGTGHYIRKGWQCGWDLAEVVHYVRFDGMDAEVRLRTSSTAPRWVVLDGGHAVVIAPAFGIPEPIRVALERNMTVLDLYEHAARCCGISPQCVRLAFQEGHKLLPALDSKAAALGLASMVGVHEGSVLMMSPVQCAAEGSENWALGLPAQTSTPGAIDVAKLRRRRQGLSEDAPEAVVTSGTGLKVMHAKQISKDFNLHTDWHQSLPFMKQSQFRQRFQQRQAAVSKHTALTMHPEWCVSGPLWFFFGCLLLYIAAPSTCTGSTCDVNSGSESGSYGFDLYVVQPDDTSGSFSDLELSFNDFDEFFSSLALLCGVSVILFATCYVPLNIDAISYHYQGLGVLSVDEFADLVAQMQREPLKLKLGIECGRTEVQKRQRRSTTPRRGPRAGRDRTYTVHVYRQTHSAGIAFVLNSDYEAKLSLDQIKTALQPDGDGPRAPQDLLLYVHFHLDAFPMDTDSLSKLEEHVERWYNAQKRDSQQKFGWQWDLSSGLGSECAPRKCCVFISKDHDTSMRGPWWLTRFPALSCSWLGLYWLSRHGAHFDWPITKHFRLGYSHGNSKVDPMFASKQNAVHTATLPSADVENGLVATYDKDDAVYI